MKEIGDIKCPYEQKGCTMMARMMALEARCAELETLSTMDSLTGYYNFRYLTDALGNEMERTNRSGFSTGLIMVDLDHFKSINDTYGHENGNIALKHATSIWQDNIRRIDIPCRYGGEEFVIILPGTRLTQAVSTAERLRSSLEKSLVRLNGKDVSLTGSFGVEAYGNDGLSSVEAFIQKADHLVYEAKSTGRNKVCFNPDQMSQSQSGVTYEEKSLLFKNH